MAKRSGSGITAVSKVLLRRGAKGAANGLVPEVFRLVSRLTPLINVDLLIKDRAGRTLLTWREDEHWAPGWHIPGGIIRFNETIAARLAKTAKAELGVKVKPGAKFLAQREFIYPDLDHRGHFISLLYLCELAGRPAARLKFRAGRPKPGQWAWHAGCPEDLLEVHKTYRKYLGFKKRKKQ